MNLKKLLEDRAKAWDAMCAIRETATSETRDMTAEEKASWDQGEADVARYTEDIERELRNDAIAKTMADKVAAGFEAEDERSDKKPDEEYREAFLAWVRNGMTDLDSDQRKVLRSGFIADGETRALGVGTGSAGGFAVPQGFRDIIVERLKYFSAVRQVATVITTDNGATLPWPTNDDTGNVGAILAENATISAQDIVLGQEQLNAFMYTSKLVLVSWQLLQDSAINIEDFLARKLGQRIGRIQNQHFTTGAGTTLPLGLTTNTTTVFTATTGSTVLIKYNDLVGAMFKVDPAYRNGGNVKWMWSDTALTTIRQLVDSQGRPLWEPSVQAGTPDMLLGKELVINNDLAVPAANAVSGAFGDFEQGYVIRDVTGISTVRLDERYADALQVGWFAFARTDGTIQDTSAYTVFKQSAT